MASHHLFNSALKSAFDREGRPKPGLNRALDTVLRVQRPLVVAWVKKMREKHPQDTPGQIAKRLERAYLRDVTVGGGAIGASAFVPGIGTATSIGLSFVAVGGYLERTALYCQAMAELHGVHLQDPEKARTMVMALMLGEDGASLMEGLLGQAGRVSGTSSKWALMLGNQSKGSTVAKTIRNMFIKRFLARQSGAALGRALPFGVGAVVGGGANFSLGRHVIGATHEAFGEAPEAFPSSLDREERAPSLGGADPEAGVPVGSLEGGASGRRAAKDAKKQAKKESSAKDALGQDSPEHDDAAKGPSTGKPATE
ncbi:di- and tripeptidase [Rothia sp. AR01]|uniref:Di- and tripeptidase n=1 Tax=Rothia santali TaxID=2949643 RepID=A0A9X2H9V4_9MICC|nr:di- and tripeptidase [Rothia santali]MCP3425331.1 di- and tripeptidase [Rothia santali]